MELKVECIGDVPLVVDMDGTLIKVDSLHEAFAQLCSKKPLYALRALLSVRQGRAAFKAAVAAHVLPDLEAMPVDDSVREVIKQAREKGRKVYLATAADHRFAQAISNSIGTFDGIFASKDGVNLKGQAKADRIIAAFGTQGFDYIGNDAADIPLWRAARTALISGASPRLLQQLRSEIPTLVPLNLRRRTIVPYLRALRPHQWLKNALVALPAIAAHDFSISTLSTVIIAFVSFSLGASSLYVVNDMLDLSHDRAHPEKRHRPLAMAAVPVSHGLVLSLALAVLSICSALTLSRAFLLVLGGYIGLSLYYSLYLKRKLMIDVVALSALYGIRVMAGGVVTGIILSHWLVGFCFFIFLSLALMKRTTEVFSMPLMSPDKIKGRGYRRADLPILTSITVASGFVGVLVLALYINSPDVLLLYRRPELLWGVCIVLIYWLGRAFLLTGRGEMHQDPVVFAATDRVSLGTGLVIAAIFLLAL